MSKEKKPTTDELFARSQWNDNMAFSSKAIDESKKKTGYLESEKKPINPKGPTTKPLNNYVNDMNQEINRMSDAVGNRMEHVGKGISRSFSKIVRPLGKSVNHVADSASEGLKSMSNGIGKAMLQEFTSVIRNLGDKVSPETVSTDSDVPPEEYDQDPAVPSHSPLAATPLSQTFKSVDGPVRPALPEADVPKFEYHFGTLLEQKVFFATIHNRTFLTERDIEQYNPEDAQQMYDWMTRGVDEIRNCAPYGQKLPIPQKGAYMNIPMYDILRQVDHEDIEKFLRFVFNRPQPFQQKALKLSEAFATWAHKGAPER